MKSLAIFKPGGFTAMDGKTYHFSESDVRATAAAYDPSKHEAPLVLGHPKTNAPAYGWTLSLSFVDGLLKAIPRAVTTKFSEWVNAGHYKKISASFYPPNSPTNPVPGVYYLRHIGFLGANTPAVRGLPDAEFRENNDSIICIQFEEYCRAVSFSAPPGYTVDIDNLKVHEHALEFQEVNQCDYRTAVLSTLDFEAPPGFLVDIEDLKAHERALEFQEANQCDYKAAVLSTLDFSVPPGFTVDKQGLESMNRILAYQKASGCDYPTAISALYH